MRSPTVSPIYQRIKSILPHALFVVLHREKKSLLPKKNLCFVRPHFSLVRDRLLRMKKTIPSMNQRPHQQIALKAQDAEDNSYKRAASQAHNCSMDSRHQRLAVYAYMWAHQATIQCKRIFFVRTKELEIAWENLRLLQQPQHPTAFWSLAEKHSFSLVDEKNKQLEADASSIPLFPPPERHFLITRLITYRS